ncbi:unnamed protein product [Mytilus edulis]|uniref:Uncharacterized protein n=1 Tax=Mytilus edulis TaxID=6550 RepID=A0A8S3VBC1_MYTED|nr:unnamed protein product [Mytilus edulis]
MVCARKKDGSLRLCIDNRELNKKTIADRQPIPRIQDVLDSLGGKQWFTVPYQGKAYHQGFMDEKKKLRYLEHLISETGYQMNPADKEAVIALKERKPKTLGELRYMNNCSNTVENNSITTTLQTADAQANGEIDWTVTLSKCTVEMTDDEVEKLSSPLGSMSEKVEQANDKTQCDTSIYAKEWKSKCRKRKRLYSKLPTDGIHVDNEADNVPNVVSDDESDIIIPNNIEMEQVKTNQQGYGILSQGLHTIRKAKHTNVNSNHVRQYPTTFTSNQLENNLNPNSVPWFPKHQQPYQHPYVRFIQPQYMFQTY